MKLISLIFSIVVCSTESLSSIDTFSDSDSSDPLYRVITFDEGIPSQSAIDRILSKSHLNHLELVINSDSESVCDQLNKFLNDAAGSLTVDEFVVSGTIPVAVAQSLAVFLESSQFTKVGLVHDLCQFYNVPYVAQVWDPILAVLPNLTMREFLMPSFDDNDQVYEILDQMIDDEEHCLNQYVVGYFSRGVYHSASSKCKCCNWK